MRALRVSWTHVHAGIGSLLCLRLRGLLLLLRSLFGHCFCLLLLLHARCWGSAGRFEVHLRLEWTSELLLRDERMCACLLR
jgi:hypothetical protein